MSSLTITKFDAARRQLRTAVELWFADGDAVSIHALACAAYQIINDLNSRNNGPDLLFDSALIKKDYQSEFLTLLKSEVAFFKYADRRKTSVGDSVDLNSMSSILFVCMSVYGVMCLGASANDAEAAFMSWHGIHDPSWMALDWRARFLDRVPADRFDRIRRAAKNDFLKTFRDLWREAGREGNGSPLPGVYPQRRQPSLPAFEDVVRRMLTTPLASGRAKETKKKRA